MKPLYNILKPQKNRQTSTEFSRCYKVLKVMQVNNTQTQKKEYEETNNFDGAKYIIQQISSLKKESVDQKLGLLKSKYVNFYIYKERRNVRSKTKF